MKRALLLAMCALLLGACAVEENDDVVLEYGPNTMMGLIQKRGVMRIGLPGDRAPLSRRPQGGPIVVAGFLVPVAAELAESLGVDHEYTIVPNDQLLELIDEGEVDIAFPAKGITESTIRSYNTTHPYFVAHQRLLVTADGIDDPADMAGMTVCSLAEPATGSDLGLLEPSIEVVSEDSPRDCARMMVDGRVQAITGPDVLLAGLVTAVENTAPARVVGKQLNTEGYGAIVSVARPGLAGYVNEIFAEIEEEGRWTRWYNEWIGPNLPDRSDAPPTMTLAEAAALFPDEDAVIPADDQG